jgi:predicted ATPase/DNA-binding SARP family transcriptional activator
MVAAPRIRLLGPFQVSIGDDSFGVERFERRAGATLVQLLALSPAHRRHRDQIIDALWPNVDLESARRRLYKATTLARTGLGSPDSIVLSGDVIALYPDAELSVDVDTFTDADLDDQEAVSVALDLYRGELLSDEPYAEWVLPYRRKVAERYRRLLRAGRRWHTLLEHDPLDEQAYVGLMKQSLDDGDFREVLRWHDQLRQTLAAELGTEPGAEATDLAVEAEALSNAAVGRSTAVPPSQSFQVDDAIFGRRAALKLVAERLEQHRLVTITGAGGSGKTHLARHAGAAESAATGRNVWLCRLGKISDGEAVAEELLDALGGSRHIDTDTTATICRIIDDTEGLLILDNCEHLLEAVRELVVTLLGHCQGLRILATSREPVALSQEVVLPLDALSRASAVEFFVEEAQRRGFPEGADREQIGQLCERLDDLPLAVQLAAARAATLGLDGVEALLEDRLDALRSDAAAMTPHHESLRRAIEWSFDTLSEPEQELFVGLASFADRFTIDGVLAVAGKPTQSNGEVLDLFDRLVRRSLIEGPLIGPDGATYRLLESIRLFARQQPGTADAADRHLSFFLNRAATSRAMMRDEPDAALHRNRIDWDDLRVARRHAADHGDTASVFELMGHVSPMVLDQLRFEYLDWCAEALGADDRWADTAVESVGHARALAVWGTLQSYRGEIEAGREKAEAALAAAPDDDVVLFCLGWLRMIVGSDDIGLSCFERVVADPTRSAGSLRGGCLTAMVVVNFAAGRRFDSHVAALEALAPLGSPYEVNHLLSLGLQRLFAFDIAEGMDLVRRAADLADLHDHRFVSIGAREVLAHAAVRAGTPEQAVVAVREAIAFPRQRGLWTLAVSPLTLGAKLLADNGHERVATMVLAASESSGYTYRSSATRLAAIAAIQERSPEQFQAWWAAGQPIGLRAAVELVLSAIDQFAATGLNQT